MITQETKQCEVCGSTSYVTKYDLGKHRILRCRQCTFMWLSPIPTPQELQEVYGENYFKNHEFFEGENDSIYGYFDYLGERFDRQNKYQHISNDIIAHLADFKAGTSRLLDVGCGYGFFLDVAQDGGFAVEGVEFNRQVVAQARRKYSFPIAEGDIMKSTRTGYDVITMFDVIEHLTNPVEAVRKCREMLAPGGLFVITTMDSDSLVSRLCGTHLEDFRRVKEHLTFPTRKSMRRLLSDSGFDIVKIASYGHTFKLGFLAQRIGMINKATGAFLERMIHTLKLGNMALDLNPHTKMLLMARRR